VLIAFRIGDEERRVMHLVPAPAVKLMKSRVLSRPGVKKVETNLEEEQDFASSSKSLESESSFIIISYFLSLVMV